MTALPTRCRNTKDALRKPFSAMGSRVRRARAERSWVGCPLRAFGFPWPRPRLSPRLMRVRREAARPVHRRRRHGGRCGRYRQAGHGATAGPSAGVCPVTACGTSTPGGTASGAAGATGTGPSTPGSGAGCQRSPWRHANGDLARLHDTGRGPGRRSRRPFLGQRCVQWRRGDALSGFGCADHDPVTRRVLHQVRGVPRRDHAEVAGRLGQRRRGLSLEHLTFERFLLLQQRLIGLSCMSQLVGALGGVGRQPQRDAEADARATRSPAPRTAPSRPGHAGSARSRPA